MDKPLVSIGLLTYNHGKYIADALEGLLSQEYERMELIILDDASCDDTTVIIDKYMKCLKNKFVRVNYHRNERNCGNIPHNCNYMIMESKGEYYYELSGDDILMPNGIRLLCETLQNHPECGAVHANMVPVEDSYSIGEKVNMEEVFRKDKDSQIEADNLFQRLMYGNYIAAPTVMLRREIFSKYGCHDEDIAYEDYEYWLRISQKEKMYYLNVPIVLYRRGENSITNYNGNDSCLKLRTAIISDFQTKRKYIGQLSKPEQTECWRAYYVDYSHRCQRHQYQAGLKWLDKKMIEMGIEIDKYRIDDKKIIERRRKEEEILTVWNGKEDISCRLGEYLRKKEVRNVAIYGYSWLGAMLYKELLQAGICIDYIIDRKGKMLECPVAVYTMEDFLPLTDAIIVAPIGLCEEIKPLLKQKVDTQLIDLAQMIGECGKNEFAGTV